MAPKHAIIFTYGNDEHCTETQKFIENAGVVLKVRDIEKNPFSIDELEDLIGYVDITHFINTFSDSYTKYRLDKNLPPRDKIYELMSKDYTLIRRPIVKSARLMTVGCDKRKIAEMLQINLNGDESDVNDSKGNISNNAKNHRKYSQKKSTPSSTSGK